MGKSEDFKRGEADGRRPQSAAEEAVTIITAPFLSEDYRAGYEKGQEERTKQ